MDEAWKNFSATGKINDYLIFCIEREKQENKADGDKPCGDRDGLKCNANWRV